MIMGWFRYLQNFKRKEKEKGKEKEKDKIRK